MTIATAQSVALEPLIAYEPEPGCELRGAALSPRLREAYGGDLWIPLRPDRPTVIANFVSTIDGVVSFNVPGAAGGGEISGFYEPDRFVMGLLRSLSDAVLIGAGTLRDAPRHRWIPSHTHPASGAAFRTLRSELGLAPAPTTVVVTASGEIDLAHRGLSDPDVPATIVTTDRGFANLSRQSPFAAHVEVVPAGAECVDAAAVLDVLADRRARLVLTEGGPHLFGQLFSAQFVDELFLTIAPQVAGRSPELRRLALVEGAGFTVDGAPWSRLVDLRRSASHLFGRYRFQEACR